MHRVRSIRSAINGVTKQVFRHFFFHVDVAAVVVVVAAAAAVVALPINGTLPL